MKQTAQALAILFALAVLTGASCQRPSQMPVVIQPDDTADCGAGCAHLKKLGCPEGDVLPNGTTCKAWCEETQKKGHALGPSCWVTVKECTNLDAKCTVPRKIVQ